MITRDKTSPKADNESKAWLSTRQPVRLAESREGLKVQALSLYGLLQHERASVMQIDSMLTDSAVLTELGSRLSRRRLDRNMSQLQLADEAGVGRSALQSIERGEPVAVTSFIRVLRALGLADALNRLVPEPTASPMELLRLQGRQRQRATGAHRPGAPEPEPGPWRWGDES